MSHAASAAGPSATSPSAPALPLAQGRILGIASGKGGVGKTWLAVTLAQAAAGARAGRRVLLFDGDLGLANVDVQLGLTPGHDISDVLSGRLALAEAVQRHPASGLDILPGRSGSGSLAALDAARLARVEQILQEAAGLWDLVVLDLGAGLDAVTRRLAAAAHTLLVVATEEPTSLTDAYAVLKLHARDRPGGDSRIVVNMAPDMITARRTYETLHRAAQNFLGRDVPLAGVVRRDPRVRDAIRHQTPLLTRHPNSPAAEDVQALLGGLGL
jgi:flagellar biosynthesis protein FlhG